MTGIYLKNYIKTTQIEIDKNFKFYLSKYWENFKQTADQPRAINIIIIVSAVLLLITIISSIIKIIHCLLCGGCCGNKKYVIVGGR